MSCYLCTMMLSIISVCTACLYFQRVHSFIGLKLQFDIFTLYLYHTSSVLEGLIGKVYDQRVHQNGEKSGSGKDQGKLLMYYVLDVPCKEWGVKYCKQNFVYFQLPPKKLKKTKKNEGMKVRVNATLQQLLAL